MTRKNTKRYTRTEIKGGGATPRVKSAHDDAFWKNVRASLPVNQKRASIHLRVDADVLEFFRSEGPGHLTRMAAILKAYTQSCREDKV